MSGPVEQVQENCSQVCLHEQLIVQESNNYFDDQSYYKLNYCNLEKHSPFCSLRLVCLFSIAKSIRTTLLLLQICASLVMHMQACSFTQLAYILAVLYTL